MQINSKNVSYQYLESLPIKEKAYIITLTDYKGLRIKVNPSGRISFVTSVSYTHLRAHET